jgi:NADPH-dependent ferric siderophore reductase
MAIGEWMMTSTDNTKTQANIAPTIEKMRLQPIRRNLTVRSVEALTPHMRRIVAAGDELAGFHSPSSDDHIKVFFSTADGNTEMRDYTPRRYDPAAQTLAIDFVLHGTGPGSNWAEKAQPGDTLQIGGPRGSSAISTKDAWWLLIGDESALPSIGRRIEELSAGTHVISLVAVIDRHEEQIFETEARHSAHWVHRESAKAADATVLIDALADLTLPDGPGFVWIAAETGVARAVRSHMIDVRRHLPDWIKAAGYWADGRADSSEKNL